MNKNSLFALALATALIPSVSRPAAAQQTKTPYKTAQQAAAARKSTTASTSVTASAPKATPAEPPCNPCLFYGGDIDAANPNTDGLFNGVTEASGPVDGTVYVPFTVTGYVWNVTGLFVNVLSDQGILDPMLATWGINKGMATGVSGAVVAAGNHPATITPTGRTGLSFTEYTVEVKCLTPLHLSPGTYWMSVVPQCTNANDAGCAELMFLSSVEDVVPPNAFGPIEPADLSYFNSSFFGVSYQPAQNNGVGLDRFSAGVIGTASPTTKDQCMSGGWAKLADLEGVPFKNQGDCIQFVNTGK